MSSVIKSIRRSVFVLLSASSFMSMLAVLPAMAADNFIGYKTKVPDASPLTSGSVVNGKVTFQMRNLTKGKFPDAQVFWAILGAEPGTGRMVHVKSDGSVVPLSEADISTNIGGVGYANYSYRMSEVPTISIPEGKYIDAARVYLSLGKPMYIKVVGGGGVTRFGGPDMANPSDPNYQTYWDFVEFTYDTSGMWANITRVDMLGFPTTIQILSKDGVNNNSVLGETESRESIWAAYDKSVPAAFKSAKSEYRIVAPGKADLKAGGAYSKYLDPYIDSVWDYYKSNGVTFMVDKKAVYGRVNGDKFDFNTPWGSASITKPTTAQVVDCAGPLGGGDKPTSMLVPVLCRAFNRTLFKEVDGSNWDNPHNYYKTAPTNYYSKFVHDHSINGLTYGFAYDDDQSGILTSKSPQVLIMSVGW